MVDRERLRAVQNVGIRYIYLGDSDEKNPYNADKQRDIARQLIGGDLVLVDDLIGSQVECNDLRQTNSAITNLTGVYDPEAVALVNLE